MVKYRKIERRNALETELTKAIKAATHYFSPKLNINMRTIRWADEVWTPSGIVDSIRFEDYKTGREMLCHLVDTDRFSDHIQHVWDFQGHKKGICFRDGSVVKSEEKCHGCVYRTCIDTVGMMITCYEVKISYRDFKSKNGHNFHGNENYYVAPVDLAKKIAQEVEADIGVIAYYESGNMRIIKKSGWRDVTEETKVYLLYNAFKKWCDGAVFVKK